MTEDTPIRITHVAQCGECHHWEPRQKIGPTLGYCPVFNKETHIFHGRKCTAFEQKNQDIDIEESPE